MNVLVVTHLLRRMVNVWKPDAWHMSSMPLPGVFADLVKALTSSHHATHSPVVVVYSLLAMGSWVGVLFQHSLGNRVPQQSFAVLQQNAPTCEVTTVLSPPPWPSMKMMAPLAATFLEKRVNAKL